MRTSIPGPPHPPPQVDPLDRRRVVLCGDAGALAVLTLRAFAGGGGSVDDVSQKQYRVNVQAAAAASGRDRAAGAAPRAAAGR